MKRCNSCGVCRLATRAAPSQLRPEERWRHLQDSSRNRHRPCRQQPRRVLRRPRTDRRTPEPAGRLQGRACRVKRQAARFRIFAHHDDGTFDEITDAEADITWTVHLQQEGGPPGAPTRVRRDLSIDPGSRTLNGPNQRAFDTGPSSSPAPAPDRAARRDPQRRREPSARAGRLRPVGLPAGNRSG